MVTEGIPPNLRYLTEEIKRMQQTVDSPFDSGGGPPHDGGMDERVKKLESIAEKTLDRLVAIERDVAVVKATVATRTDVSEAKSSIIIIVVLSIFLAQLLPLVKDIFKPAVSPPLIAPAPAAQAQPPAAAK